MKRLLFIFGLILSLQTIAQDKNVQSQTINAVRQIDSLYRQLKWINRDHIEINYVKKYIKIRGQDSTTYNFVDSLELKEYCNQTQKDFLIFHSIIQLLIDNHFYSLGLAGPGDCSDCSNEIVYKISKQTIFSYICKDLKNRCNPDDCYWDLTFDKRKKEYAKANSTKIADDILLVMRKEK